MTTEITIPSWVIFVPIYLFALAVTLALICACYALTIRWTKNRGIYWELAYLVYQRRFGKDAILSNQIDNVCRGLEDAGKVDSLRHIVEAVEKYKQNEREQEQPR